MELGQRQSIASALLAPWAITPEGQRLVVARAHQALQAHAGVPLDGARRAMVRNGVAVISVSGPLSKSPSWWCGGADYETLLHDITEASESSEVKALLLDIDSPGGISFGCGELSTAIYTARANGRRIVAYVSGQMCSAAYWIGSAAHEIVTDASGMIGSIGVRCSLVDDSKFFEKLGIAIYDIESANAPHKVVDASKADDRERVRATMTAIESVFIGDVARNRAVTSSRVKADFGRGDVFVGKDALAAGMVDRLGDFESLLAELGSAKSVTVRAAARSGRAAHSRKGKNMTMKSAKCDGCNRDMDDDDDLYCRACHGSADAKAILSITGKTSFAEALATISAWKIGADEVGAMRAQLAAQAQAAEAQAFDAAIVEAKAKGLLAPADAHKRNVAALAFKGQPNAAANLRVFLAALDPLVATAGAPAAAPVIEPAPTSGAVLALTPQELKIAKRMGVSVEAATKNKARLLAIASAPVEDDIADDDDDNEDAA